MDTRVHLISFSEVAYKQMTSSSFTSSYHDQGHSWTVCFLPCHPSEQPSRLLVLHHPASRNMEPGKRLAGQCHMLALSWFVRERLFDTGNLTLLWWNGHCILGMSFTQCCHLLANNTPDPEYITCYSGFVPSLQGQTLRISQRLWAPIAWMCRCTDRDWNTYFPSCWEC